MNWKTLPLAFVLTVLTTLAVPMALAQDQDPEQYRIEYTAYEEATKKTGAERVDALLKFYADFPKSSLQPYVKGEYLTILQAAYEQGNAEQTVSLSQRFLKVEPDEIGPVYFSADLLFRNGSYADSLPWSEQLYAKAAQQQFKQRAVFMMAFAALQTSNSAKLQKWGPMAVDSFDAKDTYLISTELMRRAAAAGNLGQASKYANKALEGYRSADSSVNGEMKRYIDDNRLAATLVLGETAYSQEQWNRAIREFRKVIDLTSAKEQVGQAYYKIGMSHWKAGKIEPEAMQAFARGYRLGAGQAAQECFKYLEQLYKNRHNGSTAGMDEFIQNSLTE